MASEALTRTPHGIPYWIEFDSYDEHWTDNGCQVSAVLRCAWEDRIAFVAEMCGYTIWDGVSLNLTRFTPVGWPEDPYLKCSDLKFYTRGLGAPDRSNNGAFPAEGSFIADDKNGNWPKAGYARYMATFRRRPYAALPDDEGFEDGTLPEYQRYVTMSLQEVARERQIPGMLLVNADNPTEQVNTKGFLPDHTLTVRVTWHQVPVDAVPWGALPLCTNRTNADVIAFPFGDTGNSFQFQPLSLLFKGMPDDTKPYAGADGGLYIDAHFLFEWRPTAPVPKDQGQVDPTLNYFGWNAHPTAKGTWIKIQYQNGGKPPYPGADFTKLFVPGFAG